MPARSSALAASTAGAGHWCAMTSQVTRTASSSASPRSAAWCTRGAGSTSYGVNHGSLVGKQALKFFGELYDIERDVAALAGEERKRIRQERARKVADALHQWLIAQRQKVPEGSATARAIDYSLKRWRALTRYIDDGDLPADKNRVENQIRPIALGRSNWLFATNHLRTNSDRRRGQLVKIPERVLPLFSKLFHWRQHIQTQPRKAHPTAAARNTTITGDTRA
jgi:hypothetical protein